MCGSQQSFWFPRARHASSEGDRDSIWYDQSDQDQSDQGNLTVQGRLQIDTIWFDQSDRYNTASSCYTT